MDNEQLVILIQSGTDIADNMLALWNQTKDFISMLAKKYTYGAEFEDLQQEGYIGLCEAVRHYDITSGVPFINYAAFWTRQAMRRYIENCSGVVRLPSYMHDSIREYRRMSSEYRKYYGCEPSENELCALLGVSREKLHVIQESAKMKQIGSLSEPLRDADVDEITTGDVIRSEENIEDDIVRKIDHESMSKLLMSTVERLSEDEQEAIRLRYVDGLTFAEAGSRLGVTAGTARYLIDRAMRAIRYSRQSETFREYHDTYLSAADVHHVGLSAFKRTWTSATELEALRGL